MSVIRIIFLLSRGFFSFFLERKRKTGQGLLRISSDPFPCELLSVPLPFCAAAFWTPALSNNVEALSVCVPQFAH